MKARLGGLARRATFVNELRAARTPLLHLDAGDAFQARYAVGEKDRKQVLAAANLYLKSFQMMGIQAYNIGDRDLALGIRALQQLARKASFPFLSSNVLDEAGKPIFEASILIERGGYKIGLIGAVTSTFINKQKLMEKDKIQIADPVKTVAAEIQALKAKGAQLLVLLGHLNKRELEAMGTANPELHVILGGQDMRYAHGIQKYGNVMVCEGYMKGKSLSVLDVHVQNGSLSFVDRNARSALVRRKADLERQIKSRIAYIETAKKDSKRASQLEYLERNLVQLKTDLQEVTLDLEDVKEPDAAASYMLWSLRGMDTSFDDHKKIADLVAAYRKVHPDPTKKRAIVPKPALKKKSKR